MTSNLRATMLTAALAMAVAANPCVAADTPDSATVKVHLDAAERAAGSDLTSKCRS